MEKLIKSNEGRKVFLILDNLRVHHSKAVSQWADSNKEKIQLFYLPPYSPEYNPDEYLNNDLKRNLGTQAMVTSVDELQTNTSNFMTNFLMILTMLSRTLTTLLWINTS